jgi:hypothetical protein
MPEQEIEETISPKKHDAKHKPKGKVFEIGNVEQLATEDDGEGEYSKHT